MSAYESLKARIRQTTLELMERSLSTKEGSMLMSVVEQVEQTETDWLPIATVTEAICANESWASEDVKETLYSLIRRGYLSEGVTIPV